MRGWEGIKDQCLCLLEKQFEQRKSSHVQISLIQQLDWSLHFLVMYA